MNKISKIQTPFPKTNKTLLFFVLLLLFGRGVGQLHAQEVISSNGGSYKGAVVQLDWTIGEPVIATLTSGTNVLTQGFHQSNLTVTALDQLANSTITLKVYPNPVSEQLLLETVKGEKQRFSLKLFDITGKLLYQQAVIQSVETINMQVYVPGNYLLRVCSEDETPIQTFKIIKN
jgi:hypothetical protein